MAMAVVTDLIARGRRAGPMVGGREQEVTVGVDRERADARRKRDESVTVSVPEPRLMSLSSTLPFIGVFSAW